MTPAPGCIASDELAALEARELGADRIDAIVLHVDRCAACAEVVAHLGKLHELSGTGDIGRYQLGRVLGSGGMGVVHEAWDPQLRRRVAVKLVRPDRADASSRQRMLREARALAQVSHPNVVAVYDVSEHGDQICVATELVDGETLAAWQRSRPLEAVVGAWIQVARGLGAAHAAGIVHRDVRPANVLVGRDGRVRVSDFGIACAASDARADQAALCIALAEALTGHRPARDARCVIPTRPALNAALVRGLRDDPAAQFPAMDALADALTCALARRRWPIALAATAIGLGIAFGVALGIAIG